MTDAEKVITPRVLTYKHPLAKRTCGHGRETYYNLAVGYCRHVDDKSECDNLMGKSLTEPLKPEDLEAAFAKIREFHSKPIATRLKVGSRAWPTLRRQIGGSIEADRQIFTNPLGPLSGIPVHVMSGPNDWPPNLVVIADQEGNAMSAWIIND